LNSIGSSTAQRHHSTVIGVVKSNRLRYAGHMIRGAGDLPQRALYRAVPEGRRNQGRPKSRRADCVNTDSRARDWTIYSRTGLKTKNE
jgi:hypothetical protein